MTQALWGERPPPPVPPGVTTVGAWELMTPVDLTLCRAKLRETLTRVSASGGAGSDDVERLQLVFEELASNALRHGRFPVRVLVTPTSDGWLIDATDAATDLHPAPAVDRDPAHGGLGLYLVARLCVVHGWMVHNGRKHVWACLRASM